MGLFNSFARGAAAAHNMSVVSNSRKAIFEMRDRLRNTPQFSKLFYQLIGDPSHPPRRIEATQSGDFWSEAWIAAYANYEPYTTHKFSDSNLGYIEGCAIYLLIQECYPNVYDFPSNTLAALENGATIKLIMKKNFVGQALMPAVAPPAPPASPAPTAAPAAGLVREFVFCGQCGTKNNGTSRFCCGCGHPLDR